MNVGTISRQALRAVAAESLENRILVSKKIIKEIEDTPSEVSHRLCADLRSVLKSVTRDPSASGEQIHECGALLARVRAFDPRRNRKSTDEAEPADLPVAAHREQVKPKPSAPRVPDGYQPEFINIIEALSRVSVKYTQKPKWTNVENENLVRVALGDIPLDSHSARQLWLGLGYAWKARGGCFDSGRQFPDLMEPEAVWLQSAICSYANRLQIPLPTPNTFSLVDEIAFR